MVYNSRSQEEDSGLEEKRERDRQERRGKNEKEQIGRLTDFFANNLGGGNVDVQCVGGSHAHDATKIFLTKGNHELILTYRGYKITVGCNPAKWSLEFERWKKQGNMTHARLIRLDN